MHKYLSICLALLLAVAVGCQDNVDQVVVQVGNVAANQAYLENFGEPPEVKSGQGYARVAYLPLRSDLNRVRAIPLYLFTDDKPLLRVLTRLVDGSLDLPGSHPQFVPFPPDTKVAVNPVVDGVLDVSLTLPEISASQLHAGVMSLVETACQFEYVTHVIIRVNGELLPSMSEAGFQSDPNRIAAVAPPTLIMIAGMWEAGADNPEEILINFDRPVTVERCEVFDSEGQKVKGEYFVSAFKMAVVIHPENAERYQNGVMLRVLWRVQDVLGRSSAGDTLLPLRRFEH